MNKITAILAGVFLLFSISALAKGKKDQDADIEIIHKPNKQAFILFVTESGLNGHLNHGDCVVFVDDEEDPDHAEFVFNAIAAAGYFPYEVMGEECPNSEDDDGGGIPE